MALDGGERVSLEGRVDKEGEATKGGSVVVDRTMYRTMTFVACVCRVAEMRGKRVNELSYVAKGKWRTRKRRTTKFPFFLTICATGYRNKKDIDFSDEPRGGYRSGGLCWQTRMW